MENPIKMDDLGVPIFLETSIWVVISLKIEGCGFPWCVVFPPPESGDTFQFELKLERMRGEILFYLARLWVLTIPETNSLHLKMDGWNSSFLMPF